MARVEWSKASGIARMSGKLGNMIFYMRGGKQFVKRAHTPAESGMSLENGSKTTRKRKVNDSKTAGQ